MSHQKKTFLRGFRPGPNKPDVQPPKIAKRLEISDLGSRGTHVLYNLCSEIKGADQLRIYRAADLRLCFRICKIRFSHDAAQFSSFFSSSLEWQF